MRWPRHTWLLYGRVAAPTHEPIGPREDLIVLIGENNAGIVDELTQNGVVMPERLFESPFTDVNAQGPLAVFIPAQLLGLLRC